MSVTTVPGPIAIGPSRLQVVRLALVALAVAVLLAASFAVGRATVTTSHRAPSTATGTAPAPDCHFGRAC
jgi:hypothetical protein